MTGSVLASATLGLASIAVLLGVPSSAEACRCVATDQASTALAQSDTVFVGKVLAIQKRGPQYAYKFQVRQNFKGPKSPTRLVYSNASRVACGYGFQRGKSYLVYGTKVGRGGAYATSRCTRTQPAAGAADDLRVLTAAQKPSGSLGAHCGALGVSNLCNRGLYCRYEPGTKCGLEGMGGVCQNRPAVCTKEYRPVCGCNGMTYGNPCGAAAAGASVDKTGPCPNQATEGTIP